MAKDSCEGFPFQTEQLRVSFRLDCHRSPTILYQRNFAEMTAYCKFSDLLESGIFSVMTAYDFSLFDNVEVRSNFTLVNDFFSIRVVNNLDAIN